MSDDSISRRAAVDKLKERLIETALNNVGIMRNVDEVLVDVAEERLENWFDEVPSAHPVAKDINVPVKDCISRQEALDALGEEPLVWTDSEGEIAERSQWRMDVAAIKAVTPVDAVPVVHGKWIHDGYDIPHGVDWMHCSVCGQREPYVPAAMTNYCTNCGARMDKKDGDGNEQDRVSG